MKPEDKKEIYKIVAEAINDVANPTTESLIKDSEKKMEKMMDTKLEKQKKEIVHELQDSNDALMKEVKDFREEQSLGSHVQEELGEKYIDHEKRIVALEEKIA